ncbi:hypothetical protein [Leptolyngbya sp. FACHB-711]|uniref:hypothetical protein n=1 Tax=unclassified Leptolyngbya TaxID=2650499 RepID=UPI00168766D3|nr:hypothetical protein [Leptolyngbya sp. FACHB-711]MBD1853580.1 hypothetical protein [Cyanobacteria bacterium FACHB-502]MBD2026542.1 hypothetical protein [Leptolyngbya sp. FACHB-711]
MSPTMMRQFWAFVDEIRSTIPLALDDLSLVQWLLRQVWSEQLLDRQQQDILSNYIHLRIALIRDMAQESQFFSHVY